MDFDGKMRLIIGAARNLIDFNITFPLIEESSFHFLLHSIRSSIFKQRLGENLKFNSFLQEIFTRVSK